MAGFKHIQVENRARALRSSLLQCLRSRALRFSSSTRAARTEQISSPYLRCIADNSSLSRRRCSALSNKLKTINTPAETGGTPSDWPKHPCSGHPQDTSRLVDFAIANSGILGSKRPVCIVFGTFLASIDAPVAVAVTIFRQEGAPRWQNQSGR